LNFMRDDKAVELMKHLGTLARQYLFRDSVHARRRQPLSRHERRALATLGDSEACAMGTLASELAVSPSALTALINRLVSKDLVARTVSGEDRRVVMIELTEQGRKRYEERRQNRLRMAKAMLSALNRNEGEQLLRLMGKIRARAVGGRSRAARVE
jgi:DNA-binding MarR family transcriptional regulator